MGQKKETPLSREVDERLYVLGMTRRGLADALDINLSYLSLVLTGRAKPSIQLSTRLADALGMEARRVRELALKAARGAA